MHPSYTISGYLTVLMSFDESGYGLVDCIYSKTPSEIRVVASTSSKIDTSFSVSCVHIYPIAVHFLMWKGGGCSLLQPKFSLPWLDFPGNTTVDICHVLSQGSTGFDWWCIGYIRGRCDCSQPLLVRAQYNTDIWGRLNFLGWRVKTFDIISDSDKHFLFPSLFVSSVSISLPSTPS